MFRRLCIAWLTAISMVVVAGPAVETAQADDFPDGGGSQEWCNTLDVIYQTACLPDNSEHVWCWGDSYVGFAGMQNAAIHAMSWLERDTDMNATQVSTCTTSTDVRFQRDDYPGSTQLLGLFECLDDAAYDVCERANVLIVRINIVNIAGSGYQIDWSDGENEPGQVQRVLDQNSCHEMGHSIGFQHHPVDGDPGEVNGGDSYSDRFLYYNDSTAERTQDCMVRGWIEGDQDWLRFNSHHAAHINAYI